VPTPVSASGRHDSTSTPRTILMAVGYNPYRRFRARPVDYVLVVVAVLVAVALVLWAFLG
jgi:hypothetical protein